MDRKQIKRLPSAWPSKGFSRTDYEGFIVLCHPDRPVMISEDGINWQEVNLLDKSQNKMMAHIEFKRLVR